MGTFKSAQKSAKKSVFANKSAQKSTLKSTFGSSEPICVWEVKTWPGDNHSNKHLKHHWQLTKITHDQDIERCNMKLLHHKSCRKNVSYGIYDWGSLTKQIHARKRENDPIQYPGFESPKCLKIPLQPWHWQDPPPPPPPPHPSSCPNPFTFKTAERKDTSGNPQNNPTVFCNPVKCSLCRVVWRAWSVWEY